MTDEDLAAQLREGLRQRQNDTLFTPGKRGEGPLTKPEPWRPPREKERTCSTGKKRFPTHEAASNCLDHIKNGVRDGKEMRMYTPVYVAPRCRKCQGFHVTSKIPRQT